MRLHFYFNYFTVSDEDINEIVEFEQKDVSTKTTANTKLSCHSVSSTILDCIYREWYKVCPKEKFTLNNAECMTLKNYTLICDDW